MSEKSTLKVLFKDFKLPNGKKDKTKTFSENDSPNLEVSQARTSRSVSVCVGDMNAEAKELEEFKENCNDTNSEYVGGGRKERRSSLEAATSMLNKARSFGNLKMLKRKSPKDSEESSQEDPSPSRTPLSASASTGELSSVTYFTKEFIKEDRQKDSKDKTEVEEAKSGITIVVTPSEDAKNITSNFPSTGIFSDFKEMLFQRDKMKKSTKYDFPPQNTSQPPTSRSASICDGDMAGGMQGSDSVKEDKNNQESFEGTDQHQGKENTNLSSTPCKTTDESVSSQSARSMKSFFRKIVKQKTRFQDLANHHETPQQRTLRAASVCIGDLSSASQALEELKNDMSATEEIGKKSTEVQVKELSDGSVKMMKNLSAPSGGVLKRLKLLQLGKNDKSRRHSQEERNASEIPRSRTLRSVSLCDGDLSTAAQALEKFKEENESLRLEVRGKDEELDILNATLDQVNQNWESHMQTVRKELESQKKENEQLRVIITKEPAHPEDNRSTSTSFPHVENISEKEIISKRESASHNSMVHKSSTYRYSSQSKITAIEEVAVTPSLENENVKEKLFYSLSCSKCLSQLSESVLRGLVNAMRSKRINKGEFLMREGIIGQAFYVLQQGSCKISKQSHEGVSLNQLDGGIFVGLWEVFGDLEVFYNTRRAWSCRCVRQGVVWYMTRKQYRTIVMRHDNERRRKEIYTFLKDSKRFQKLNLIQIRMLAKFSRIAHFVDGDCILKKGTPSNSVYVIKEGEVTLTKKLDEVVTCTSTLSTGELFGNLRAYSCCQDNNVLASGKKTVQCIVIPIKYFEMVRDQVIFAPSNDETTSSLLYGSVTVHGDRQKKMSRGSCKSRRSSGYESDQDFNDDQIIQSKLSYDRQHASEFMEKRRKLKAGKKDDFKFIATIGKGAFGSVDLVSSIHDENDVYAIKKLPKEDVTVEQRHHIYDERDLQLSTSSDCPFVTSLYSTFEDDRFVHFVMEFCPGGELFTLIKQTSGFNDSSARFYVGCVIEALTFLHSRDIIFRDLKPENVVLDRQGYCKLTDFGFAKKVSSRSSYRSYSYCGTPEYMAPEIILNQAHSFTADLWSLGVFIFEILTGRAPFRDKNRVHLADSILDGIEPHLKAASKESRISVTACSLIKKLCYPRPDERLGSGRKGISEVIHHPWFQTFDWELLRKRMLPAPWKPSLNNAKDQRYFEDSFRSEKKMNRREEFYGWDENF